MNRRECEFNGGPSFVASSLWSSGQPLLRKCLSILIQFIYLRIMHFSFSCWLLLIGFLNISLLKSHFCQFCSWNSIWYPRTHVIYELLLGHEYDTHASKAQHSASEVGPLLASSWTTRYGKEAVLSVSALNGRERQVQPRRRLTWPATTRMSV